MLLPIQQRIYEIPSLCKIASLFCHLVFAKKGLPSNVYCWYYHFEGSEVINLSLTRKDLVWKWPDSPSIFWKKTEMTPIHTPTLLPFHQGMDMSTCNPVIYQLKTKICFLTQMSHLNHQLLFHPMSPKFQFFSTLVLRGNRLPKTIQISALSKAVANEVCSCTTCQNGPVFKWTVCMLRLWKKIPVHVFVRFIRLLCIYIYIVCMYICSMKIQLQVATPQQGYFLVIKLWDLYGMNFSAGPDLVPGVIGCLGAR